MQNDFGRFYKGVRKVLQVCLPRFTLVDFRTTPQKKEPVVYVSHHQNLFGPVTVLMRLPFFVRTWVLSVFMDFELCYHHYLDYTLTRRLNWPRWLAKVCAWPFAKFAVALTQSGRCIPVNRQSRAVIETMKDSVETLKNGESILLFPDVQYDDNSPEVKEIYEGFLYIEKYYYRETGEHVAFVPIYSDRSMREIRIGNVLRFSGKERFFVERKEMVQNIQDELNRLATINHELPAET